LDKDGLDLIFTLGSNNNVMGAKTDAPKEFRHKVFKAFEQGVDTESTRTDMSHSLSTLLQEYINDRAKKRMTLLVITDGTWDKPLEKDERGNVVPCALETKLQKFMERYTQLQTLTDRWFTIQFIQIGEDQMATERLQRFDDDLAKIYKNFP
jgi:uncharacterized protein with von Willebrand factor type A (vWA) domain